MNRKEFRKARSSRQRTIIKVVLAVAVTALLALSAYGIYLVKKAEFAAENAFEDLEGREMSELREEQVEPLHDNISILFVGVDDSAKRDQDENSTRTDALVLATLNNEDKTIKMVSIPRDSYVYIPEVGYRDKITHAYGHGGTLVTVETVEELLEVPVDYYVKMDFNAFIEVINALDGITVDVPFDIVERDENDKHNAIKLDKGTQLLNGSEALAFARTRQYDNDIERGKRQQMILAAVMDKVVSAGSFTKYGDVIEAVGDNMKTDLTFQDMQSFFEYAKNGKPEVETLTLEGYDDMSTGVYYWQLREESLQEVTDVLQSHLGLKPDTSDLTEGEDSTSLAENEEHEHTHTHE